MNPITRKEKYLAKAAGQDVALPAPVTREEMFLAKMAGQDVSVPAPITRMEMFLNAAAENAGGGGGELDAFIDGSLTEIESNVENVASRAFYYITRIKKLTLPNVTSVGSEAFMFSGVESISLPSLNRAGKGLFKNANSLTEVNLPKATGNFAEWFYDCYSLKKITLPSAEGFGGYNDTFYNCKSLEYVDLPVMGKGSGGFMNRTFYYCYSLKVLILRYEGGITSLGSTSTFNNCYHFVGTVNATYNPDGLKDGYIYVPASLVDSYKTATNWTTFADQFRALEDYTVDGTITGELDPAKTGVTV